MNLLFNGDGISTDVVTLAELLDEQGVETKGVAVAVNRRVVARASWAEHRLEAEDQVIVVSAVYGG